MDRKTQCSLGLGSRRRRCRAGVDRARRRSGGAAVGAVPRESGQQSAWRSAPASRAGHSHCLRRNRASGGVARAGESLLAARVGRRAALRRNPPCRPCRGEAGSGNASLPCGGNRASRCRHPAIPEARPAWIRPRGGLGSVVHGRPRVIAPAVACAFAELRNGRGAHAARAGEAARAGRGYCAPPMWPLVFASEKGSLAVRNCFPSVEAGSRPGLHQALPGSCGLGVRRQVPAGTGRGRRSDQTVPSLRSAPASRDAVGSPSGGATAGRLQSRWWPLAGTDWVLAAGFALVCLSLSGLASGRTCSPSVRTGSGPAGSSPWPRSAAPGSVVRAAG